MGKSITFRVVHKFYESVERFFLSYLLNFDISILWLGFLQGHPFCFIFKEQNLDNLFLALKLLS